ncbi:glycoside hydrolase family 2 TIM barrel-domain containing protein [Kineococcus sp. SYSU DK003]|uniref:glycoside hydrolase family 2 TIM barrel-domain containing protein n=1 Tax=Kineococcus sp. SYSU DK003 TaxID=3383124 RepID=UPI003D7C930D
MNTHETVSPPVGVVAARYRPPAGSSDAGRVDLDGTWGFRLFDTVDTGVARDDPGADWDRLEVPGHWQLAGAPDSWPYGTPAYSNLLFPFPIEPPFVPDANPTGEYRRTFTVPDGWPAGGRTLLRFEGVDSWFEVALNGEVVAVSHGSRLPTEVDVTDRLRSGENLLAVRVTQWSAMSYVEDQDQWWLSGIFRSVSLEHRPAGGVDHVRLHTGYDATTGQGTLTVEVESDAEEPVRVEVPELGIDTVAGQSVSTAVEPWSAERPRLYDVVVTAPGERVVLAAGFRTVSIRDGVFLVNDAPVKLRGVNRHEFDPLRGRSVTPERMLEDVLLMKRHHVNAVRTSHYPPHPHFLDLCDRYGLYVVDENDLETHGFLEEGWAGNPVDDPAWEPVLVDRVTRTVRRDAHHPSIVLWSLGNEAGSGCNVAAMVRAVRTLDPTRPVHYEGDFSSDEVDVYSRMYAPTELTELIGRGVDPALQRADADARRRAMPFVLCEYAHAMGNGPGGLSDYDELFDRYPRLMGGFVWEWIDHGLTRKDADGTPFAAYGGDFGELFHDGTFVADGMVLPDRTPSPALREFAAVSAPVRLDTAPDGASLVVRNRQAFRGTDHLAFEWTLHRGHDVLATGTLPGISLAPGERVTVRPPADLPLPAAGRDPLWWTLRAVQPEADALDESWVQTPFTVSTGQLLVGAPVLPPVAHGPARTVERGFAVGPARFDRAGNLRELHGRRVAEFRVDAWRAPTDNDRRSAMWEGPSDQSVWEHSGLHLLAERKVGAGLGPDGEFVVTARTAGPRTRNGFRTTCTWRAVADDPDAVDLHVRIDPEGRWGASIARTGLLLALEVADADATTVDWSGLGPGESYADSRRAAVGGAWRHTVAQWQTNYTHPQENGARRGVTHAALGFADGTSLVVEAGTTRLGARSLTGVELSLRPWSDRALGLAAHPHELVPDGLLWMHLDAAQHGLGSASCGPGVLPNAQLHPAPVELTLRFGV